MREDALLSQPFDLETRAGTGTPIAIAKGVQQIVGEPRGVFSASDTGLLLYQDGGAAAATSLVWFDANGKSPAPIADVGAARGFFLSPDERFVALNILDAELRPAVVDQPGDARTDAPDVRHRPRRFLELRRVVAHGRELAYSVRRDGKIFIARVGAGGGQEQRLFELPRHPGLAVAGSASGVARYPAILYISQSRGGCSGCFSIAPRPARRRRCLSPASGTPGITSSSPQPALDRVPGRHARHDERRQRVRRHVPHARRHFRRARFIRRLRHAECAVISPI